LSCAICEIRKEKRFCPAVHGRICPQCCGEQREVTLDCPSDCSYLQQARQHEKPRSADQFDPASLFLHIEISEQFTYEREHLLMGLSYALNKAAQADRSLNDRDLITALSALCRSCERRVNSGLHYEQPLTSAAQQAVWLSWCGSATEEHRAGPGRGPSSIFSSLNSRKTNRPWSRRKKRAAGSSCRSRKVP
jgi:hypothetical protein